MEKFFGAVIGGGGVSGGCFQSCKTFSISIYSQLAVCKVLTDMSIFQVRLEGVWGRERLGGMFSFLVSSEETTNIYIPVLPTFLLSLQLKARLQSRAHGWIVAAASPSNVQLSFLLAAVLT